MLGEWLGGVGGTQSKENEGLGGTLIGSGAEVLRLGRLQGAHQGCYKSNKRVNVVFAAVLGFHEVGCLGCPEPGWRCSLRRRDLLFRRLGYSRGLWCSVVLVG